ncbi:MAG: hypothetical protein RR942_05840 [Romboutsia sp.]
MSCECSSLGDNGKVIADLVRKKGFENMRTKVTHEIDCECGNKFLMETLICTCPNCNITYAVTPCSSNLKENIKSCGTNY